VTAGIRAAAQRETLYGLDAKAILSLVIGPASVTGFGFEANCCCALGARTIIVPAGIVPVSVHWADSQVRRVD